MKGRQVVPLCDRGVALAVGWDSGAACDHRYTQTTFPHFGFATSQRGVACAAAVVGGEEDIGVAGKAEGLEFVKHDTGGSIEVFHHGSIVGALPIKMKSFGHVRRIVVET